MSAPSNTRAKLAGPLLRYRVMAIVTGVLVRIYRLLVLTHGSNNWIYLGSTFAMWLIILLGMLTAHLANYPLQQYLWRAPLFAAIEVAAEMATSALLLTVGREANGTTDGFEVRGYRS